MEQYSTLLLIVAMIALFYFLILRPQKKRQQKMQETLNSLTPGTDVLLASGVFGTIVEIGERQAVIEVSPGVHMTVLKQAISRVTTEQDLEPTAADGELESDDGAPEATDADQPNQSDLDAGGFTVPDDASSLTGDAPATRRTDGYPDAGYQGTPEPDNADLPESERPTYDRPTFERPTFDRPDFASGEEDPNGSSDPKKD